MKCKICGADSGKYPLCQTCNIKREKGEIIKCEKCKKWHYMAESCSADSCVPAVESDNVKYLYCLKNTLISKSEQGFFDAIGNSLPEGYRVFPQINLASFIDRTDDARFHNELFRNVDFLITDPEYRPRVIIEINDQTHFNADRKERDEKVKKICEESGIPIITLWTSYGINTDYIKGKIDEKLKELPVKRVHHFGEAVTEQKAISDNHYDINIPNRKKGCYIATCVYGSYDCPEVWVLRRFRDNVLSNSWYGRLFIKIYYFLSPAVVKVFGNSKWFINACKALLDNWTNKLQNMGFENSPYYDN
ncbi:MAG: DUF2726 domain-containing protein [Clostridia bacterium]|nr:DUF2726 domain-containing protein [Clostridia bacterium]